MGHSHGPHLLFPNSPVSQLGFNRADQLPVDYRSTYSGAGLWNTSRVANLFGQVNYQLTPAIRSSTNFSSSQSYSNGFGPYFGIVGNGQGIA